MLDTAIPALALARAEISQLKSTRDQTQDPAQRSQLSQRIDALEARSGAVMNQIKAATEANHQLGNRLYADSKSIQARGDTPAPNMTSQLYQANKQELAKSVREINERSEVPRSFGQNLLRSPVSMIVDSKFGQKVGANLQRTAGDAAIAVRSVTDTKYLGEKFTSWKADFGKPSLPMETQLGLGFLNKSLSYAAELKSGNTQKVSDMAAADTAGGIVFAGSMALPLPKVGLAGKTASAAEGAAVRTALEASAGSPNEIYQFRSKPVSDYVARGGDMVKLDYASPQLQTFVKGAVETIEAKTGFKVGESTAGMSSEALAFRAKKISEVWVNDIVPVINDKAIPKYYGQTRNYLIKEAGGRGDLGAILDAKCAVCREHSLAASVVLAEFGLASRVVSGNVGTSGHAWLNLLDRKGNSFGLLDSNNTMKFHPDYKDYRFFEGRGVTPGREYEIVSP